MNLTTNWKDSPIHLFGTIALATCGLTSYLFGLRPVRHAEQQLRQAEAQLAKLADDAPRLAKENEQLAEEIRRQRSAQHERFPIAASDTEPVLDLVSRLLIRRDLSLVNFRDDIITTASATAVELQVKGEYRNLVQLIADLRTLERPARIKYLNISATDEYGEQCQSRIKVEFSPRPISIDSKVDLVSMRGVIEG